MHVYMVHLSPYGKQHTITVGAGEEVRLGFVNKYDPFITMVAHSIRDAIPSNLPGLPILEAKKKFTMNASTPEKNDVNTGRRQVAVILHSALVEGGVIKNEVKVPWMSLENKLLASNKKLEGWPSVSRTFAEYSKYNKHDIGLILSNKDTIRVVDFEDHGMSLDQRESSPADLGKILRQFTDEIAIGIYDNLP